MLSHRAGLGAALSPQQLVRRDEAWGRKIHVQGKGASRGKSEREREPLKNPPWQTSRLAWGECKHTSGRASSRLGTRGGGSDISEELTQE